VVLDVNEAIEKMIEEKLGLYEPKNTGRRTANEIRDQIQFELQKRPKTTTELQNAIKAHKSTVENHCQHLEKIGAVESISFDEVNYWKPKNH
jgi:Fic family protein